MKSTKLLLPLVFLMSCFGCIELSEPVHVFTYTPEKEKKEAIEELVVELNHKSSYSDVVTLIGEPQFVTQSLRRAQYIWHEGIQHEAVLDGFVFGLPIVGDRSNAVSTLLFIYFDEDWFFERYELY